MKVIDLKPGMKDVDIVVEIDYVPKNSWGIIFVKDDTKDIKMILQENELKQVKEGMKIRIKKGYVIKNKGQLQLNPHKDHPIEFIENEK